VQNLYGSNDLTAVEKSIVELIHLGCKNGEIASYTGTTKNVIKNKIVAIYNKLGFSNRLEVALWYEVHKEEV
jgi:DNA-binding NarL/FixJ family response regulator